MKILIINHYSGSPSYGMEYRSFYFAKEWTQMGHKLLIVTASFTHLRSKQFIIKDRAEKINIEGIEHLVLHTPQYKNNNYKRIINILFFLLRLFQNWKKIAEDFNPNIIIVSSTFCFDIYTARKIANFSNSKLVFEVHDLWPLSPMELGDYSKYHPYIYLMQKAENYAYKHSSSVVSILPKTESYMLEHGLAAGKFVYIPNGICIDDWNNELELPETITEVIKNLKLNGTKILAYAGNHGIANALGNLIDAMVQLQSEKIVLLMIGNGQEKKNLIKQSKSNQLENVIFLPAIAKTYMPSLLEKMDILFISLQNQPVFRFGISPNKLIDYMMAGKPIIQAINAGNDIVKEAKCGISIDPENTDQIVSAVKSLLIKPDSELTEMGRLGREYCLKNHDFKILAKKFLDAIE